MGSFDLLGREMREYIYDQGWPALTKIQEASIKFAVQTDNNLILSAPTASGKTEAAFLPAINSIQDWSSGLKVVYVSPLIALINDQFKRIDTLCSYLDINVTGWHGEASASQKRKLLKTPNGILLITPESIEAMLVLRPGEARNLFAGTEWILVDEIHGFMDNNRGIQLRSLLERLQHYMQKSPRYIGMSATLHPEDSQTIKKFFANGKDTSVLVDHTRNRLRVTKEYYESNSKNQSDQAIAAIYDYSQNESMLVFPNSRSDVERIATNVSKLGKASHSHSHYFAHHSSISKEIRLTAENFAKSSTYQLFTICCTSTLELGIDIGAVDSIVQYNAPHSVASLGQRLGRSGRKTKESILHFMATNPWDLLQGLAAISLYECAEIDRLDSIQKPYDVLAHQVLAIILEYTGLPVSDFKHLYKQFSHWSTITDDEYKELIQYLLDKEYIEIIDNQVITGISTERLLKGPDFFAHFVSEDQFGVYNNIKKLGEIPLTPSVAVGINIFLAAQVWKITDIDLRGKKIYVIKAIDGNPPVFMSGGTNVSHAIRQKMKDVLISPNASTTQNKEMQVVLDDIRADCLKDGFPYMAATSSGIGLRTFAGTRINKTLQVLFSMAENTSFFRLNDKEALIYNSDDSTDIRNTIKKTLGTNWSSEMVYKFISQHTELVDRYIGPMKYKALLPQSLQIKYIIENILEIKAAQDYLRTIAFYL